MTIANPMRRMAISGDAVECAASMTGMAAVDTGAIGTAQRLCTAGTAPGTPPEEVRRERAAGSQTERSTENMRPGV